MGRFHEQLCYNLVGGCVCETKTRICKRREKIPEFAGGSVKQECINQGKIFMNLLGWY